MAIEKEIKGKETAPAGEQTLVTYQTAENSEYGEIVLSINRCSKVVKGGRNFSFGALVVVGDKNGKVGYGYGKANEVSDAIRKGGEAAKKNMISVPRRGLTVPHSVTAKYSGSSVLIRPASEGTGMIAGGTMRAVLSLAGVVDATFKAIKMMQSKEQVLEKLGKI